MLEKPASWLPSFSAIYQKANTEYTLGKYERKPRPISSAFSVLTTGLESYIGLARIAVKQNNLGIANEMLAQAVNLDPNNAENIRAQGVGTQADG